MPGANTGKVPSAGHQQVNGSATPLASHTTMFTRRCALPPDDTKLMGGSADTMMTSKSTSDFASASVASDAMGVNVRIGKHG